MTSNPYADPKAARIDDSHFTNGGLQRISYARPGKLFTANTSLMVAVAGTLDRRSYRVIIDIVVSILKADVYT